MKTLSSERKKPKALIQSKLNKNDRNYVVHTQKKKIDRI